VNLSQVVDTRRLAEEEDIDLEGVVDYKMLTQASLRSTVAPVTERELKDSIEIEKFMNEMLVIRIHDTNDKNAPPRVFVGDNGEQLWLPRKLKIRIPRRFVERLAQSHEQSFTQKRNQDPNADEGMTTASSTAQPYPFEVIYDPRGVLGQRWLRRTMREGV
jgi:hypothetical protein